MALITIDVTNSVLSIANDAFEHSGSFPLSTDLTVETDGFLLSAEKNGANLYGNWNILVAGNIGALALDRAGILLNSTSLSQGSKIEVAESGHVHGATGIKTEHCLNVVNDGHIFGFDQNGIHITRNAENDSTIVNHGLIYGRQSGIYSDHHSTGVLTIRNYGEINGGAGVYSQSSFDSGAYTLIENHSIIGSITTGDANDVIDNVGASAEIQGVVDLGGGHDRLFNSGTIDSGNVILLGWGDDTLVNTGFINEYIYGDSGEDKIVNEGVITGDIDLGFQDDSYDGRKARANESVLDGGGSDTIYFGRHGGYYVATGALFDGEDIIRGGKGSDFYDASSAQFGITINLDKVTHGVVQANTAAGPDLGADRIFDFDVLSAGSGDDEIYGSAAGNFIIGNDGNDRLCGGGGKDLLDGGRGDDTFVFLKVSESGTKVLARDVIYDFKNDGRDLIDLSAIDAKAKGGLSNDSFTYLNPDGVPIASFTRQPGELRSYFVGSAIIVEGDINGDAKADFSIEVRGFGLSVLNAADFLL